MNELSIKQLTQTVAMVVRPKNSDIEIKLLLSAAAQVPDFQISLIMAGMAQMRIMGLDPVEFVRKFGAQLENLAKDIKTELQKAEQTNKNQASNN